MLDDYQSRTAAEFGPWETLPPDVEVVCFSDHAPTPDALVARLRPFDVVVAMRERSPFPREVLERLPQLRLLVTTGMRNASIDVAAATELGVVVCGTGGRRHLPTVVATPHVGYVSRGTYEVFFDEVVEDITAFLGGSPIRVVAEG